MTIKKYLKDTRGLAAVEFAFILPVLFTLLVGSVGAFDLYKADRMTSNAANIVVDLASRQPVMTNDVRDALFASGIGLLGQYGDTSSTAITIASIIRVPGSGLEVGWSFSNPNGTNITDANIASLNLPTIPDNESVVYIRLNTNYSPAFGTALDFNRESVRRPRFVATIAYDPSA